METAILSEVGQYASLKLSWSNLRTSFKLSGFRVFARDSMTSLNQFCPGTERNFFCTYFNPRPLRFICADIVFKLRLSMPIGGKSIGRSGVVDHTSFISSPEEIRYTLRITGMLKKYGTHTIHDENHGNCSCFVKIFKATCLIISVIFTVSYVFLVRRTRRIWIEGEIKRLSPLNFRPSRAFRNFCPLFSPEKLFCCWIYDQDLKSKFRKFNFLFLFRWTNRASDEVEGMPRTEKWNRTMEKSSDRILISSS